VANLPQLSATVLKTLQKNLNITATMHTFMGGLVSDNGQPLDPGPSAVELLHRMKDLGHTAFAMASVDALLTKMIGLNIVKKHSPKVSLN
jgi:protein-disulfide isomerase-like protein with CxxC motif